MKTRITGVQRLRADVSSESAQIVRAAAKEAGLTQAEFIRKAVFDAVSAQKEEVMQGRFDRILSANNKMQSAVLKAADRIEDVIEIVKGVEKATKAREEERNASVDRNLEAIFGQVGEANQKAIEILGLERALRIQVAAIVLAGDDRTRRALIDVSTNQGGISKLLTDFAGGK